MPSNFPMNAVVTVRRTATALLALATLLAPTICTIVFAGDIVATIGNVQPSPVEQTGGFFELGIRSTLKHEAALTEREDVDDATFAELELAISAGYRYKRLFFEASRASFDGVNLGVILWQNQNWSVDFLAANFAGRIDDDTAIDSNTSLETTPEEVARRESQLLNRDTLFVAAGARVTGYFGNSIAQFRWVADYYENNGMLGSARLGRQWQRGNWNLHGYAGVRYYSSSINNYWFGVTADEATERYPTYLARNAFLPEAEIGASYPLTRDWVFASQLRYLRNTDTIVDSPLVDSLHDVTVSLDIKYVF